MKRYLLITTILLSISSCSTTEKPILLSPEDRALLNETRNMAADAKQQSMQALLEARHARESADRAASSAKISSEKADRIFRESQVK